MSDINLTDRIRINRRPDHHTEHDSGLRLLAFNDRERQGVLKDRTNPISLSILVGEYDAEAWITLQETINFQYELAVAIARAYADGRNSRLPPSL